jgi:hypothetical protein
MRHPREENGGFSDQRVWSAIRYLDPERNCQNAGRPVLVPVIVFLTFWLIFLAAMYLLTVRVSHPGISSLETMKTGENRGSELIRTPPSAS